MGEDLVNRRPKALVTIDWRRVELDYHSEEEEGLCFDGLHTQLSDASIEIKAYTQALKKVGTQLVAHQQGQLWYEKKIRFMKIDLDNKTDVLTYHKKLLMSANDKFGLGYGDHRYDDILTMKMSFTKCVYEYGKCFKKINLVDRFLLSEKESCLYPTMIGNYMPSGPDIEIDYSQFTYGPKQSQPSESETQTSDFDTCESNISVETPEIVSEPVVNEPNIGSQPKVWTDAPIIEEYESDSDDYCVSKPTKEQEQPSFADKQVKTPRETVKNQFTHSKNPKIDKKGLGYGFTTKSCFVCGSLSHLIRDCDFYEKRMAKQVDLNKKKGKDNVQMESKPVWNNVQRVNHKNQFVPRAVLTKTSKIPVSTPRASGTNNVSTARHNFKSQAVLTNAARKISTVKPFVNRVRPKTVFHKTHSPFRRPFNNTTALRTNFTKQKVNTAEVNAGSDVGGKRETAVKPSAGCNWRPKRHYWHKISKYNGGSRPRDCATFKDPLGRLKPKQAWWMFQAHETGNKTYFDELSRRLNGALLLLEEVKRVYITVKFDGKSDEGFLVGYSLQSKAFRVYNLETKRVEENLHITFLENKPNVAGKGPTWLFDLDYLTDSMNYQPVRSENQANKHAGPQEANQNAGTKDNIDAGDSEIEAESAQDYFVLPIWSSYTSTVKSSKANNAGEEPTKHPDFQQVDKEDQVFLDELERLKRQEQDANDAAKALRKEFAQETKDLLLQAGAAKASSTNIVNTASTPVSTASPYGGLSFTKLTNADQDDSEIPALEEIYNNLTDGIFTHASYDDEGAVADFTNLETIMNVSPIPTSRINSIHPSTLILGDPKSAVQTRSNLTKSSGAHAFMSSMGELTFFLGLQVKQKEDGIFISQDKYVAEILKKFDFASVKTASTPIETQKPLVKDEEASDMDVSGHSKDLPNLNNVKRILDSDYAGANLDRKSTTGGCQFLGRRLISWQCKKQTIVATSTTEAEYVAAINYANCWGKWLKIHTDVNVADLQPRHLMLVVCRSILTISDEFQEVNWVLKSHWEEIKTYSANKGVEENTAKLMGLPTEEHETPSFANQQVKPPREAVKNQFTHSKNPTVDKKGLGYGFTTKACFVCGSLYHLIRDCDFHEKRMAKQAELNNRMSKKSSQREIRPIWNNVQRVNHKNQFVPTAVLTRTSKISVNTARASGTNIVITSRHNFNRQAVPTNAAMKVNIVKPIVNRVRPKTVFHKTHSPFSRPFNNTTALRTNFSKQNVNTAEVNAVSAVGGKRETAVKPSAGCNWRPKGHYRHKDYPHRALQNKGIVDSGCSRHMTGNKAYLAEYQDFNGGPVAFGGMNEEKESAEDVVSTEGVVSTDKEKVSTDRTNVSTNRPKVNTDKEKDSTVSPDEGTVDQTKGRSATPTTPTTTLTMFGDDETISQVLLNMSQAKAVSREKEKGVELKDVEETERPRPTSTRSLLTLKPLPKIDPKDKGKKKIKEEDETDIESEGIPEAEKKFKQLARDEEMARKVQEDWEAEEVKKLAEEEAIKTALSNEYDFIQARMEADRLLALRLQDEKRERFTLEERAKFLHDTIAAQRRFLEEQRVIAIRNKPPTRTQLRNQMMIYLKHVGNKKHSDLKNKTFEDIQALYKKVKRFDESFTAVGSTKDERMIKEMNQGAKDPDQKSLKKRFVKETSKKKDTAKLPAKVDVTEQGTKKRKGGHMKMIARKRKRSQPDINSDDEHKKCLKIVTFEGTIDSEIMEKKSFISKLDKVSSPEGDYLVIHRVNGNFRAFNYLLERIVTWRLYEACGVYILELKDGTVIHMLVERRYPLSKDLLQRMLDLGLEVKRGSIAALDLIKFIKQQIGEE
ncbi:ribonuclease H-like domain-containing protein [Tanacetum coccineum]